LLDLRMNYRNLLNEMNLHGGRLVSHQYALMKPRRKNTFQRPKELEVPEGMDPVKFRRVARRREREKQQKEADSRRVLEEVLNPKHSDSHRPASGSARPRPVAAEHEDIGRLLESEDEDGNTQQIRDPTAALEVQELMNDTHVRETFDALQDPPGSGKLPKARISRSLEALGFVDADQATIKATMRALLTFDPTIPDSSATLAFDEFCAVVVAVSSKRQQLLRQAFKNLDRDGSGTISVREFRHLLWDLGFTVTDATVEDIFKEVDLDQSGQVEMHEFEEALRILHERHGFTQKEANDLMEIFDRYDTDRSGEMSANELASALGWFGTPTTINQAQEIIRKFDQDDNANLCRCEFLMVMRWRLEDELAELRALFAEFDVESRGALSEQQLSLLFQRLGYTIPHEVIHESVQELGPATVVMGIVFEDVCRLLATIRKREGFSKTEMNELLEVYRLFDKAGKGELREFELAHAVNWLGYPLSHSRRRKMWVEVDVDKNNSVDEGEFLKMARKLREDETAAAQALIDRLNGAQPRKKDIEELLLKLGYTPEPETLTKAAKLAVDDCAENGGRSSLLGFLAILRLARECQAEGLRRSCGLPEELAQRVRTKFKAKLDDGKRIDPAEFERFMYELYKDARTQQSEREKVKNLIKEHCEGGTLGLNDMFWCVRLYSDSREEEKLAKEMQAQQSMGFSEQQVAQFRAAFVEADTDGSGELSEQEILALFDEVATLSSSQLALLHAEIGKLGDQRDFIGFSLFLRILGKVMHGGGD